LLLAITQGPAAPLVQEGGSYVYPSAFESQAYLDYSGGVGICSSVTVNQVEFGHGISQCKDLKNIF
jgi:hypothetical protein